MGSTTKKPPEMDDLGMGMSNFDGKVDESIEVGADFRLKEKALSLAFEIKILE